MNDHVRRYFTSRFRPDPHRDAVWRHLSAYLARFVPPEARVLELGAGYCGFINRVHGRRRVAIDSAEVVTAHAAPGVEALEGNAVDLVENLGTAAFDFVFASNFFEHLEWADLDRLLASIVRVLAPGGRLCLVQPNFRLNPGRYFDDYTHRTVFTDVALCDWLTGAGFRLVAVEPRFMPLTVKSRLGGLTFLIPLYLSLPWRPLAGQMLVVAEKPGPAAGAVRP